MLPSGKVHVSLSDVVEDGALMTFLTSVGIAYGYNSKIRGTKRGFKELAFYLNQSICKSNVAHDVNHIEERLNECKEADEQLKKKLEECDNADLQLRKSRDEMFRLHQELITLKQEKQSIEKRKRELEAATDILNEEFFKQQRRLGTRSTVKAAVEKSSVEDVLKAKSHFDVLGLTAALSVDSQSLKDAKRRIMLSVHPDKNPGLNEQAKTAFHRVNEAFEHLKDGALCAIEYQRVMMAAKAARKAEAAQASRKAEAAQAARKAEAAEAARKAKAAEAEAEAQKVQISWQYIGQSARPQQTATIGETEVYHDGYGDCGKLRSYENGFFAVEKNEFLLSAKHVYVDESRRG